MSVWLATIRVSAAYIVLPVASPSTSNAAPSSTVLGVSSLIVVAQSLEYTRRPITQTAFHGSSAPSSKAESAASIDPPLRALHILVAPNLEFPKVCGRWHRLWHGGELLWHPTLGRLLLEAWEREVAQESAQDLEMATKLRCSRARTYAIDLLQPDVRENEGVLSKVLLFAVVTYSELARDNFACEVRRYLSKEWEWERASRHWQSRIQACIPLWFGSCEHNLVFSKASVNHYVAFAVVIIRYLQISVAELEFIHIRCFKSLPTSKQQPELLLFSFLMQFLIWIFMIVSRD